MSSERNNAFDLLRLLLAMGVVITHSYLIGGYGNTDPIQGLVKGQTNLGEIGVMGFFGLSGYLITASYERSKNLLIYLSHRCFRLLPGLWACLFITAFIFAPLIFLSKDRSIFDFPIAGQESAISYVLNNFLVQVRQWNIRNVLDFAAYPESLNGSLWSLFPEVQCYGFTLLAGYLGLFNKNRFLLILVTLYFSVLFAANATFLPRQGPTFLVLGEGTLKLYTCYVVGTLLYVYREHFNLDKSGVIFLLIITLLLLKFGGYKPISPIIIPLLLINLFSIFQFKLKIDLSYGIYIYSFPLQQLIHRYFENHISVNLFIFLSLIGSCLCGLFSYVLVEKPFIKYRKWLDKNYFNKQENVIIPKPIIGEVLHGNLDQRVIQKNE